MNKRQFGTTAYQYALILILLTAIAYSGGRNFLLKKDVADVIVKLENIQEIYPTADYYTQNRHGTFDVYNNDRDKIGSALLSSDYSQPFGYGGIVPLLIGVDDNLKITKIV